MHKRTGRGECYLTRRSWPRRIGWHSRRDWGWPRWLRPGRWRPLHLRMSGMHKRTGRVACSLWRSNLPRRIGWHSQRGWVSGFRRWRLKHPSEWRMRPSLRAASRRLRLPESGLQGRCWQFARPLQHGLLWRMGRGPRVAESRANRLRKILHLLRSLSWRMGRGQLAAESRARLWRS